ncbi:MAG: signal peptidase I [Alicyclobacillus sp.]|nr:signal peptidase I [Alicyclobacillus sp.]
MAEKEARPSIWRELWGWVWPIALGCLIAFGINRWVVSPAWVPSASMAPTIPNPCYILVNHVATELHPPARGEVVLFHFPDDPSKIYVKRVIGLPGDTVIIRNGQVYVNGQPLKEPYLTQPTPGTWGPYQVPQGEYFMLGDNRSISDDSRYWVHPYVPLSYITGEAVYVLWPLNKAAPIH